MLIIDTHVHIYDDFDLELLCDTAYTNFLAQATKLSQENNFFGVLLLAEKANQTNFSDLVKQIQHDNVTRIGQWSTTKTNDPITLKLTNASQATLFIIQGRQLNSKEGIEVLSLLSDAAIQDRQPLADIIKEINQHQAIAVIPWAFGKWLGKRGLVLKSFIKKEHNELFFLGDNGGRPSFFLSRILSQYKKVKPFKILSGSDPLPLQNEEHRVGSFGVYINAVVSDDNIRQQLYDLLLNTDSQFFSYGKPLRWVKSLCQQYFLHKNKFPLK